MICFRGCRNIYAKTPPRSPDDSEQAAGSGASPLDGRRRLRRRLRRLRGLRGGLGLGLGAGLRLRGNEGLLLLPRESGTSPVKKVFTRRG